MERPTTTMLRVGAWCVDPAAGQISRDGESARLDTRAMRLLLCLAEHPGEVVSIDELLTQVWSGVTVSPDSVYQAVASLRRVLGDDPKQSAYIATVPRLGYRMVATVGPWVSSSTERAIPARSDAAGRGQRFGRFWLWAGGTALCLVLLGALLLHGRTGNTHPSASPAHVAPQRSIAVLPFLDLTEGMHEETFADGMTEELIDKLSKVPEFRVPAPTSSFYFKNKQIPLADIARRLGVVYVLDGSVRKSGARLRVAARLMRADDGYVLWSEVYDRPFDDILMVQDDIAGEVTKALRASIEARQGGA
jgi:TolB-like protein/DNA-binding winged helix-turn-helix (wHTH) protein